MNFYQVYVEDFDLYNGICHYDSKLKPTKNLTLKKSLKFKL